MAPSARTVHKAEAKYGVTADYPDLQLHSAAANGNVGLVKYALMHGQPVNSVLNGVLPIHIAASSGNEVVVQMLIDAGADVNAARLPRKYNADRSKAISSIGAAGSTPLHFAAANGHAHIVSLLLSHGANPDLTEKHGLTPEDLAREAGHVNVLTVFRLWKQRGHDVNPNNKQDLLGNGGSSNSAPNSASATTAGSAAGGSNGSSGNNIDNRGDASHQFLGRDLNRSSGPSIGSAGSGGGGGGHRLASSAASIHSVASSSGRKLLAKPSLDSISSRGKKLAKAASNPNLAGLLSSNPSSTSASNSQQQQHQQQQQQTSSYMPTSNFAQAPVALRQNPSKSLASYMSQGHLNAPLIHHVISLEKSRRPSLPSVFEKAAHPSQSIKHALGLTPSSGGSPFGHRSGSSSSKDNDPYHLGRPHRSTSKNSLAGMFRHHHHSKEKSAENYNQPLSPAASTFFTGDDELEQAEREAFLRADREGGGDSGDESTQLGQPPFGQRPGSQGTRRTSAEGLTSAARSRAGSASSAATSQSNRSYAGRTFDRANVGNFPMTAPPTQTTFTHLDDSGGPQSTSPRPGLSTYSSANSVIIPQPIPPPPSSSTQPFFSKAAISAAHNNPPVARPGFYRPRKSSQLSTTASTMSSSATFTFSPDSNDGRTFTHSPRVGSSSERPQSQEGYSDSTTTLIPPALIVRKPSMKDGSTSSPVSADDVQSSSSTAPASPRLASRDGPSANFSSPASSNGGSATFNRIPSSPYTASPARHVRSSSDTASRQSTLLADVKESPESQYRTNSRGPDTSGQETHSGSDLDADGRRESEDVFPPEAERPFSIRSRANSRARIDNGISAIPSINLTSSNSHYTLPNVPSGSYLQQPNMEQDAPWRNGPRAHRSDSTATTTDTRTSRSGSVGESGGPQQRFFGFDYSSSPTGSTASFKYHPSSSTTATSLVSSPPGTAVSGSQGTTVTHAQAQFMVKRKQEELLSYDPSLSSQSSGSRRPSLSQQLAAYGDSLAIERELQTAEQHRQHPHERIALTIPDPPASAKYSWEILGKESRTQMPVSKGQRAREKAEASSSVVQQQKLWTHRMVSPYEVPLNRPGTNVPGHRHTPSAGTITSGGKKADSDLGVKAMSGLQINVPGPEQTLSAPQSPAVHPTFHHVGDQSLRNKPSSTLSISRNYLAPPQAAGSSDLSVKKSPRLRSISPSQPSPRSSSERDREKPSTTYHVVAGPGSEPTDSANSSLVSEPRSGVRMYATGSTVSSRHRYSRSDPPSASHSPEAHNALEEQTPRPPQLLRLETVSAPKFHIEQRAGGEAAPSPTKPKFGSKFGKLFK